MRARPLLSRGLVFAALLLAGVQPAFAAAPELKPFTASYVVKWGGITGSAQIQLEKLPDDHWSYRRQTTAPGWVPRFVLPAEMQPRRSVMRVENDLIVPETFSTDDGTSSDSKDQSIVFDWAAGRVRGVVERKAIDLATRPGLQDELSVQVALMQALIIGKAPERFAILDKERIKEYVYTTEGRERLQTDVGSYETVIYRSARPGSRNGTVFWCAPELGYLPLKVERREGKEVQWSMRLRSLQR